MQKYVRIDEDGMFLEDVLFPDGIIPTDEDIITVEVPEGFYHPRWNGEQWVEGKSQEEINEILNAPVPKTPQQEIEDLKQLVADLASLTLGV